MADANVSAHTEDADQHTVRVAVRVRPISEKEVREGGDDCVELGKDGQTIMLNQEGHAQHSYAFDHVFGTKSTQPEVFHALGKPLLDKAFEGFNSTIFAYGQTGSGKTHTMMSDRKSDDRGLIPRISEDLFSRIGALSSDSRKFLVCCSFLEIYNEIVYDLLAPRGKAQPKTGLEIREQKGIGVYVKDLQEIVVDGSEKLQKLIDQGFDNRATAATQMNAASSRSHCLFIIKMHQKDDNNASNNNFSKMNLVDLAGSERAAKTGAQGDTLKEGANINKSLSALGNVINALSSMASGSKKVFIPYRNSKLTRVLQESLGGNALTTMMAACSPAKTNLDETLSTLNYAKRAKTIKVNASKNEEAEQLAKLEEEVEALRAKLAEQASGVADTSRYEQQIQEMEAFMKQTWADKEQATQQHEQERQKLAQEAQKRLEQVNAEKIRRLKLLEDKGDLELSMQDLKSLDTGSAFIDYSHAWPKSISKVVAMEQKVATQCRAVGLCKDAVMSDVEHWCEQVTKDDDGGAAGRMMLQQAERKAASMLRELEALGKQERELEGALAALLPEVDRVIAGSEIARKEEETEKKEGEDKEDACSGGSEEFRQVLSVIGRQLQTHRAQVWGRIAEDHRGLSNLGEGIKGLLGHCAELGSDTTTLSKELELEIGGSSGSDAKAGFSSAEAAAALARPLGLSSGVVLDAAITVSSNPEAATYGRLLNGVQVSPYGGWCPAKDAVGEYLQVDLGSPHWVCGVSTQGRRPVSGSWEQTRPLLAKVLEASVPLPPARVFKRPPVRLIHDVVVAVHTQHKAFSAGQGIPDFSPEQLDYKKLQSCDRQAKVDFFELLLTKTQAALKTAGETVTPLAITPGEILGGKNTEESNRLLQLLCYLALRRKANQGGLFSCSDQWVTRFTVHWSEDGSQWTAVPSQASGQEALELEGSTDALQVRYNALGPGRPPRPVRFLRVQPMEWHVHPGLRLEVHGWAEGDEAGLSSAAKPLSDRLCRLDVVRGQAEFLRRAVELASAAAAERWREAQKAEEDRKQQAMSEKTQVEQQLADALSQLEELKKCNGLLEEQVSETQQKLIDADTEKLKLEVDRDRAESQVQSLEEKLNGAMDSNATERENIQELEGKVREITSQTEDLQLQVGVLTEERDCARTREEELFEEKAFREEELMNTNQGYVYLTDRLHEVQDEYEEKVEQRDHLCETLNERNQELMNETLKLRQEIGEMKRKLGEAEKAVQRAEKGLPVSFRVATATTTASDTPGSARGYPSDGKPDDRAVSDAAKTKKRNGKDDEAGSNSEYEEDFDDEM